MISDVLSEAVVEIERYQKQFAGMYEPMTERIEEVKAKMRELRAALDAPDSCEGNPPLRVA